MAGTVYKPPYYTVRCDKHGTADRNNPNVKVIRVGAPKGKKEQRDGGCPMCKKEEREERNG